MSLFLFRPVVARWQMAPTEQQPEEQQMKALMFKGANLPIELVERPQPEPAPGELLVQLAAASMNHRDVWMTQGLYPGLMPDVIPGSCGAGWVGDRPVVINPNRGWGDNPDYPNQMTYRILGMPDHGTFAEYIAVAPDRLQDKPAHLTMAEAAALPLAGLTAYRALFTRARLRAGDKVLINGVGGGVALLACQFALAAGAEVFVTSSSAEKIDRAVALGASGGVDYREERWAGHFSRAFGGVDVVVDSAGGDGFAELLKVCQPRARIVTYGGTHGKSTLSPQILFFKELEIYGSTMGNDDEFAAMVAFVAAKEIRPVIDAVYTLEQHAEAYERMRLGQQFGKIVFQIRPD
ncbi:MAG: zinc-binding dehydrogenase [Anaerolineales bacterium]|nr:zinc-binding dehydrogenase [Anaerolineales bacterium]